jgi:hypothetical protein
MVFHLVLDYFMLEEIMRNIQHGVMQFDEYGDDSYTNIIIV